MIREYEFTFISRADLPESGRGEHFDKYESLLLGKTGEILKKDNWGVKKLAFPIKKHFRGMYVHYDFVTDPVNIAEAVRLMRIDDNVLRYMAVRVGDCPDIEARKAELAKKAEPKVERDR